MQWVFMGTVVAGLLLAGWYNLADRAFRKNLHLFRCDACNLVQGAVGQSPKFCRPNCGKRVKDKEVRCLSKTVMP
jgi:hypothetical protein